jgi:hypothetical protein
MVPLRNENSPNGENNFSEKYEKTTEKKWSLEKNDL